MININQKSGGGAVTYGAYIVQNGLILNLDAANVNSYALGLTISDLSGYNNNGSLLNYVDYTTTNMGALVFNGVNSFISFPTITFTNSPYTLEFYGYIIDFSARRGIFCNISTVGELSNSSVYFANFTCDGISTNFNFTSPNITVGTPFHWVFTVDNNKNTMIYLNSTATTSSTQLTTYATISTTFNRFGISLNIRYYTGNLYSARIYNRALSATEVMQNYMATRGRYITPNTDIVRNGLVMYVDAGKAISYPGTGLTWSDITGNNNTGSLINLVDYTTSNNGALVFNGINSYINITGTTLNSFSGSITICAWINTLTASAEQGIIWKGTIGSPDWGLELYQSKLNYQVKSNYKQSTTTLLPNTWYNVCISHPQGGTGSMYINGIFSGNDNGVIQDPLNTQTAVKIGLNATSYYFSGSIPFMQVYNRALSATEVLQNYNALSYRFNSPNTDIVRSGLVLNLDAGKAISYPGTGLTWSDISGYGLTVSLLNGVGYTSSNMGGLIFDGIDDYISIGTQSLIQNDFTINIWYKLNSNSVKEHFLFSNNYIVSPSFLLASNDQGNGNATLTAYYVSGGGTISNYSLNNVNLSVTQTYNITLTRNGIINTSYINGVIQTTFTNSTVFGSGLYELGYASNRAKTTAYLQGNIYVTQIYNRALTATEILQNYNSIKGRFGL